MKPHTPPKASSLFLFELIIAILIFIAAAAICLQIFANSKTLSYKAAELDSATLDCSKIAEMTYVASSENDLIDTIKQNFNKADISQDATCIEIETEYAAITCEIKTEDRMITNEIKAYSNKDKGNDKPIYSLKAEHYIG